MKKIVLLTFVLVLLSTVMIGRFVRPVKADWTWTETIYIRANGSVDPDTAPISSADNTTYTLTDNIVGNVPEDTSAIDIERDSIVVDGASYTLQGAGVWDSKGISLSGRSNVTVKNMEIKEFYWGIEVSSSNNIIISGNNITNNNEGIVLEESSNNSITENTFVNCGLAVLDSYTNHVVDNLVNGKQLVYLENVSDYTVENAGQVILVNCSRILVENLDLSNTTFGVELLGTNNTKIARCNMTNNESGIGLRYSSNNIVSGNNVANNYNGIWVEYSSNNILSENNVAENPRVGIMLCESSNVSISANNSTENFVGIWLFWHSDCNNISGNKLTANNSTGIYLSDSSNNTISGNDITNNGSYDFGLDESSNNTIYHNNFINNENQTYVYESYNNTWNAGYPSGGNYWSGYNGTDANRDGIGDISYTVDENNTDNYPLMGMFSDFNATLEHHVQTICNSSISDFQFNSTALSFNVTGETDTTGFCRVCIPTALMNVTYKVYVNGTEVPCNLLPCSNSTHSYLYFSYDHSTQEVMIIPEFPTWTSMLLILIVLTVAIVIYKRRLLNPLDN